MTRKLNPETLLWAVYNNVYETVNVAVFGAVSVAVGRAVQDNVYRTVDRSVYWPVYETLQEAHSPHQNINRFLTEIRQARARWGAA